KAQLGEFDQAHSILQSARSLAKTAGERLAEARALLALGELALASGDPDHAVGLGQQASDIFREIETPPFEERALTLLRDARAAPEADGAAGYETDDGRRAVRGRPRRPRRPV